MMPAEVYWFLAFMSFIFGCLIGSFLNVCIYRMPLGMSVNYPRRSFCFRCGSPIKWYDNIPVVSYLVLRGRDRQCGAPFSPRYALVELLTGVVFLVTFFVFNTPGAASLNAMTLWYMAFLAMLIIGIFTDTDHWIIPRPIPVWGTVAALLVALFSGFYAKDSVIALAGPFPTVRLAWPDPFEIFIGVFAGPATAETVIANVQWWEPFANALIGAAFGYSLLRVVGIFGKILFRKEAMGLGDADLFMLIGATIGAVQSFLVLFIAAVVGSILGGVPILLDKFKAAKAGGPDTSPLRLGEYDESADVIAREEKLAAAGAEADRLRAILDAAEPATPEMVQRARDFAAGMEMDFVDLDETEPEGAAMDELPAALAIELRAVPLKVSQNTARVAVADPNDTRLVAELRRHFARNIRFAVAPEGQIAALQRIRFGPSLSAMAAPPPDEPAPLWKRYARTVRLVPEGRPLHHLPFIPSIAIGAFIVLIFNEHARRFLRIVFVPEIY